VFDKDLIPLSKEFGKVQTTLLAEIKDVRDSIAGALLPSLIELGKILADFLKENKDDIKTFFSDFGKWLTDFFKENKDDIKVFISNLGQLASSAFKAFKSVAEVVGILWDVFAPVLRPIQAITAALYTMSNPWVLIDALVSKLEGRESVFDRLKTAIGQNITDLGQVIVTAKDLWVQVFDDFFNWIGEVLVTAKDFWAQVFNDFFIWIGEILVTAKDYWAQVFNDFFIWIGEILVTAKDYWAQVFNDFFIWIGEILVTAKDFWVGLFQDLFDIIIGFWTVDLFAFFDNLIAKATNIGDAIKSQFAGLLGGDEKPQVAATARALTSIGQTGVLAPGSGIATATALPGIVNAPKNDVTVAVQAGPGMNEQQLAVEVARKVEEALQRQNRNAFEALMPGMATG
jgi:hypothetical protein